MNRLSARRFLRSGAVGLVATVLAGVAHVEGGGHVQPSIGLGAYLAVLLAACWLASSTCWTFRRLFLMLMAGQLGFHLAASTGAGNAMDPAMTAHGYDPMVMAGAHFLAAVVFALVLARVDRQLFRALDRVVEALVSAWSPVAIRCHELTERHLARPVVTPASVFGVNLSPLRGPPCERIS